MISGRWNIHRISACCVSQFLRQQLAYNKKDEAGGGREGISEGSHVLTVKDDALGLSVSSLS